MSIAASRLFLARILEQKCLSTVVGVMVHLRPDLGQKTIGRRVAICCPFHDDKSFSLTLHDEKQMFSCRERSCGAQGNAIELMARLFPNEAFHSIIRELAQDIGVEGTLDEEEGRDLTLDLPMTARNIVRINQQAADFYVRALAGSKHALAYLDKRGLSEEVIAEMGIGYAPAGWQNLRATAENYDSAQYLESGLTIDHEKTGQRYDRFRDRIMFPIKNTAGFVIGFGGRILEKGDPKYLNSPETPVFSKGSELYGLDAATQAIEAAGYALVTEGYMDVVSLRQMGVKNAVATLGTATSSEHTEKLLRTTRTIVYAFDGDKAGKKAAWRALEAALPYVQDEVHLRFLFLPAEHDPDSFVREFGKAGFEKAVKDSLTIEQFVMSDLQYRFPLDTLEARAARAQAGAEILTQMPLADGRLRLTQSLAHSCGLSEDQVALLSGVTYAILCAGDSESSSSSMATPSP